MQGSVECLRCRSPMRYLKEYRFDSRAEKRGLLATIFDLEEHLIFHIYVCPQCRHSEFFYSGAVSRLD